MAIVRLHGVLKEESGVSAIKVKCGSVREALANLPEGVEKSIEKYGKYVIVLLNGKRVYEHQDISLSEEDVIDLTLLVGGG